MQRVQARGSQFQAGGTVREGAFYVERSADRELYRALQAGEFCYVLAPRQIGKSSLRSRTEKRLRAEGVACASVDLTRLGSSEVTQDEWYYGLIEEIAFRLDLEEDPADFWIDNERLSPVHRWSQFMSHEVLPRVEAPIVVFIDEIDAVLSLPFSRDDFFAAIRAFFNARSEAPMYERLTFCLLGVAAPSDLISDPTRTPFNVGRDVRIEDFSRQEAQAFLPGLQSHEADELLEEVYSWTRGHPYMTQRVFEALLQRPSRPGESPTQRVEQVVSELFLQQGGQEDTNLTVAEKLFHHSEHRDLMLQLYRGLLEGRRVEAQLYNPVHMALRLTGMISTWRDPQGLWMQIRNRIFARVFDRDWLKQQESERLISGALELWLASERDEDYVLRGNALQDAQAWAEGREDVSADERAFLFAGMEVARLEEEQVREAEVERERRVQAEQQARFQRRTIRALGGLVLALVGLLAFAYWQYDNAQRAQLQERRAKEQALKAQAGESREKAKAERALQRVKDALRRVRQEELKKTQALTRAQKAERDARRKGQRVLRLFQRVRSSLRLEKRARRDALQATNRANRLRKKESLARQRAEQAERAAQEGNRALALAAQGGREMAALRAGILGVVPSLRSQRPPPNQALEGLFSAVNSARRSRPFRGHRAGITAALLSRSGRYLLTASKDQSLRLTRVADGRSLAVLKGHTGAVLAAALSVDQRWLVSGSQDRSLRLWDLGDCLRPSQKACAPTSTSFRGHTGAVRAVAFSATGRQIASASDDGTVRLWDRQGKVRRILRGHRGAVFSACFSPSGQQVASAGEDRTLRLWPLKASNKPRIFRGHTRAVRSVVFSPKGDLLLSASLDGSARLWKRSTGKQLRVFSHARGLFFAAFSPSGRSIGTAGMGPGVRLWSRRTGKRIGLYNAHNAGVTHLSFSRRGGWLATASLDASARVWQLHPDNSLRVLRGHRGWVNAASFSSKATSILTASGDGTARVWSTGGRVLLTLKGHKSWVTSAAFSHDQRWIATSSLDRTVRLWRRSSGRQARVIAGRHWLESVAFSPVSSWFASAGHGGRVRLFDLKGRHLRSFKGHQGPVKAIAFSRKGPWLVSGSQDRSLRLWDLRTGRSKALLEGHKGAITSVAFSPDGRRVLSASKDGTAQIWRSKDGKRLAVLRGHTHWVLSAAFSHRGQRIVTTSRDRTVRLWDSATARQIASFRGHTGWVLAASFSPDDRYIVTGSTDRTARIFPASEGLFLRMGCRMLRHHRAFQKVRSLCIPYLRKRP